MAEGRHLAIAFLCIVQLGCGEDGSRADGTATEQAASQAAEAERLLLRNDNPELAMIHGADLRAKYAEAFHAIIAPEYAFKTTSDPEERERIVARAISIRSAHAEEMPVIFRWLSSPSVRLRRAALSGVIRLVRQNPSHTEACHARMIQYWTAEEDMVRLAEALSASSQAFHGLAVPEPVLATMESRAAGSAGGPADYVKAAVSSIRRNGSKLGDLPGFPRFEAEGYPMREGRE